MAPIADVSSDCTARLIHLHRNVSNDEMGSGGESNGTSANNRHTDIRRGHFSYSEREF
jgi:hypothetical protein